MSNLPKLRPVAQAGDGTPEGDSLATFKQIYSCGGSFIPMSEDEVAAYKLDLQKRTAPPSPDLVPQGANTFIRRGKRVWRTPNKAGADLDRPPLSVKLARMEQRYIAELNKNDRLTKLLISNRDGNGVKANQAKADKLKTLVLSLKAKHPRKGTAFIATQAKTGQRNVQLILKKNKTK